MPPRSLPVPNSAAAIWRSDHPVLYELLVLFEVCLRHEQPKPQTVAFRIVGLPDPSLPLSNSSIEIKLRKKHCVNTKIKRKNGDESLMLSAS